VTFLLVIDTIILKAPRFLKIGGLNCPQYFSVKLILLQWLKAWHILPLANFGLAPDFCHPWLFPVGKAHRLKG
jgi:hypothetical protein